MPKNKRKKTRFIVRIDEIERQLFSCEERQDGTLIFGFEAGRWTLDNIVSEEWSSCHISFHPSEKSKKPGRKFTQIFTLPDGSEGFRRTSFIHRRTERPFIAPVLVETALHRSRKLEYLASDEMCRLVSFQSDHAQMCFALFASDPGTVFPRLQGFSLFRISFRKFDATLYTTFYSGRPPVPHQHYFVTTALPVRNGVFPPNPEFSYTEAIPPQDIEAFTQSKIGEMIRTQIIALGFPRPSDEIMSKLFTRWPRIQSAEDSVYGEDPSAFSSRYTSLTKVDGSVKLESDIRDEDSSIRIIF